jgi:hypothetical protein
MSLRTYLGWTRSSDGCAGLPSRVRVSSSYTARFEEGEGVGERVLSVKAVFEAREESTEGRPSGRVR